MDKLKILSFNILSEQFIDYGNPEEYYKNVPVEVLKEKNRLPKIFAIVKKIDADVMLFQEVDYKVLRMLKANFHKNYIFMPLAKHKTPEAKENLYGNLTVLRKKLFKVIMHNVYHVPGLGSAFGFTEVTLNGKLMLIVNIHLDADEETEKNRIIEAKTLMLLIKPLLKTHTVVITGDFNTNSDKTHKKFSDLTSVVSKKDETGTYLNDAPMIDWIYVKNAKILSGKVLKPEKTNAATPLKKFGSDHYPIEAVIGVYGEVLGDN